MLASHQQQQQKGFVSIEMSFTEHEANVSLAPMLDNSPMSVFALDLGIIT